eukprot:gene10954-biopygen7483
MSERLIPSLSGGGSPSSTAAVLPTTGRFSMRMSVGGRWVGRRLSGGDREQRGSDTIILDVHYDKLGSRYPSRHHQT